MGAWAYCTNEDCQRGFDRPSFAEITARKRECPFCGTINHVCEDLGTALDAKFEELANLTAGATDSTTTVAAGQEANTAPQLVGMLTYSDGGIVELHMADGGELPPGYYTISLTEES